MAKRQHLDRSAIAVAVIAAFATLLVGFWQFVWKQPGAESGEFFGRVSDGQTYEVVWDAKISWDVPGGPIVVYSDAEGIFRFRVSTNDPKFGGSLRVEAAGYRIYERFVELTTSAQNPVQIHLSANFQFTQSVSPTAPSAFTRVPIPATATPTLVSPTPLIEEKPFRIALQVVSNSLLGSNPLLAQDEENKILSQVRTALGSKANQRVALLATYGYTSMSDPQRGNSIAHRVNEILQENMPEVLGQAVSRDYHFLTNDPSLFNNVDIEMYFFKS